MIIIKRIIAALLIVAGLVVVGSWAPASAATVTPYFFRNETASNHSINLWSQPNCTGTVHPVYTGQQVSSDGWDCARAMFDWTERIYDVPSGRYLAVRYHKAGEAVNLSNNRHSAYVYNS
jgi:hypothetical protein